MSERTSTLVQATGSGPGMRPQTIAQGVVASLPLPPARPAPSQPASPLPQTGLRRLPRDASLLYDIGRVDGSGRIASNDIVRALNWSSGWLPRPHRGCDFPQTSPPAAQPRTPDPGTRSRAAPRTPPRHGPRPGA